MNKKVVASAVLIGFVGVSQAAIGGRAITPVVTGAYVFLLMLAILDMFGGQASTLAGALAMLAVVYVLLTQFPWSAVTGAVKGKQTGGKAFGTY